MREEFDEDRYSDMEAVDTPASEGSAPEALDEDEYPDMEAVDMPASEESTPETLNEDEYPDMEAVDMPASEESAPETLNEDEYPDMEAVDMPTSEESAPETLNEDEYPDMEAVDMPASEESAPEAFDEDRYSDMEAVDTPASATTDDNENDSSQQYTTDGPIHEPIHEPFALPSHEESDRDMSDKADEIPALPPHEEPLALPPHEESASKESTKSSNLGTRNYYDILASLYVPEGDFEVMPKAWRKAGSIDRTRHMAGRLQAKDIKFNRKYFKNMFSSYGNWKSNWKYNLAHLGTGHFAIFQPVITLAQKLGGKLFLTGNQRKRAEIFRDRIMNLTDEEIEELMEHAPEWMTESTQPKVVMDFLNQRYEKYKLDRIMEHQRIIDANVLELIRRKKLLDQIDPNTDDPELMSQRAQLLDGCGKLVRSVQEHLLAGLKLDSQGFGRDIEAYNSRMSRVGRRDSRVGITFNERYADLIRVIRNPESSDLQLLNAFFGYAQGMREDTQRKFGLGVLRDVGTAVNGDNLFNISARRLDRRNDFLVQAAVRAASLGFAAANIAAAVHARNANAVKVQNVNSQNAAINGNNARFDTNARNVVDSANRDIDTARQRLVSAQESIDSQNETIGNLAGQQAISSQQVKGLEEIHSAHRGFGGLTDAQAHQQMYDEGLALQERIQQTQSLYDAGKIDSLQFAKSMLEIQQQQQGATLTRLQELAPDLARYAQSSPGFNYQAELDLPTIYQAFGTQNISVVDLTGNYILSGNTQLAAYINGLDDSVRATVVCSLAQYALVSQSTKDLKNGVMAFERATADRAMDEYFGQDKSDTRQNDEKREVKEESRTSSKNKKINFLTRLRDRLSSGRKNDVSEEEISEEEVTESRGR